MRSIACTLHQAADADLPLSDVREELIRHLGVDEKTVNSVMDLLDESGKQCAGDVFNMNVHDLQKINKQPLQELFMKSLAICLGSASDPHDFTSRGQNEVSSGNESCRSESGNEPGPGQPLSRNSLGFRQPLNRKGGIKKEASEILTQRRAPFQLNTDYNCPAVFDQFHKSNIHFRNDITLRNAIVHEIYAVCGDLYPDWLERELMLKTIEEFVGPPRSGGHWFNWRDPRTNMKHKGSAISDIERARRNAAQYGVSSRAMEGRIRPDRSFRPLPTPALSSAIVVQDSADKNARPLPAPGPMVNENEDDEDDPLDDVPLGLWSEDTIMSEVQKMSAQLHELQQTQKQIKESKKNAAEKLKQEKAANKLAKKNQTAPSSLSQYEKDRLENIKNNKRKLGELGLDKPGLDTSNHNKKASKKKKGDDGNDEGDDGNDEPPPPPPAFADSEVAKKYTIKRIDDGENSVEGGWRGALFDGLFVKGALVAMVVKPAKDPAVWMQGSISNIGAKKAIWARIKESRNREYCVCQEASKSEEYGRDYFFIEEKEEKAE